MRKQAFEDLRQERSSESTASLCRNPLRGWRKFAVVWLLALPLTLSAASRTVTATVNRDAGGVAESIELTFGECGADFRGKLYVAYGDVEGSGSAYDQGWKAHELLSDAVTAEMTGYRYTLPEGWGDTNLFLRFFLFSNAEIGSVKDYYVQDGLVAMFDGVDNAGTGAHDDTATTWLDLVTKEAITWNNAASWQGGNSLQLDHTAAYFPFAPSGLGRLWTVQMTLLKGGSGTFLDSSDDNVWCSFNGAIKFAWRGSATRPSVQGWRPQSETLTVTSEENWFGVNFASSSGEGNWNKVDHSVAGTTKQSKLVCFGGIADAAAVGCRAACIRVYNKPLSDADMLANNAIDTIRFYGGEGSLPAIGSSVYSLVGISDTVKADPFVVVESVELGESAELNIPVTIKIGGHDVGSRFFTIYAVLDDGSEQVIKTQAVPGNIYATAITGLEPQRDYTAVFYAKDETADSTLTSPLTSALGFKTKTPVIHDGKTVEGTRSVSVMSYSSKNGLITGVTLELGECAEDWQGDLYMGYGAVSGLDMQRGYWTEFVKLNDTPLTAADRTFFAAVPEGWHSSVWCMRFFLETCPAKFVNAADYYVTDGLIACFDAIDNAGTGVHDSDFGYWVDLTTQGYDIQIAPYIGSQLWGWTDTSLMAKSVSSVPLFKNCFDYKTIEIAAKYNGKYEALFWAGNGGGGKTVITGCTGDSVQFNISGMLYPIGDTTYLYGACVYSSSGNQVYIKSEPVEGSGSDSWGSTKAVSTGLGMGYGNGFRFTGEYYAIRLYDRELTAEEIAHNYRVDSIRYGGAEGELTPLANSRPLITASTQTIFARQYQSGLMVIIR